MDKIRSFTDLIVWQKAHQLVLRIYKETKCFPAEEKFGLVSQIRRSAVSVPANIAEGFRKKTNKDKAHYYNIAQGYLDETKYYLILSKDLGYIKANEERMKDVDEIHKMIHRMIETLR